MDRLREALEKIVAEKERLSQKIEELKQSALNHSLSNHYNGKSEDYESAEKERDQIAQLTLERTRLELLEIEINKYLNAYSQFVNILKEVGFIDEINNNNNIAKIDTENCKKNKDETTIFK